MDSNTPQFSSPNSLPLLITICARGGSKGIPNKNILPLNGLPLIAYTIRAAQRFAEQRSGVYILLSTDSEKIAEVAADYGVFTSYRRPDFLASDTAGKVDAIADALNYEEERLQCRFDYVLDLDVTSPLRTQKDLEAAFTYLKAHEAAVNLFSVSPPHRNPYFNMVEVKADGYVKLVKQTEQPILSRQKAPQVYDINGSFYFYKRAFFESKFPTVLTEHTLVYVSTNLCFDLDYPQDYEYMSWLLANNKLGFEI